MLYNVDGVFESWPITFDLLSLRLTSAAIIVFIHFQSALPVAPWSVSVLIGEKLVHEAGECKAIFPGYALILFHLHACDRWLLIRTHSMANKVFVAIEVDRERPDTDIGAATLVETEARTDEKSQYKANGQTQGAGADHACMRCPCRRDCTFQVRWARWQAVQFALALVETLVGPALRLCPVVASCQEPNRYCSNDSTP